jgi:hypothetical protein
MKKIALDIVALSHSVSQSQNYAVVLAEHEGQRRLPIVIGSFEAQAIAVAMERMTTNRPLTHDLFKNTLDTFQIDLQEIIINNLVEGVFYASLVCLRAGEIVEIDSRTSDALALAVRFNCPIFTYDFVMDDAGVVLEEEGPGAAPEAESDRKGRSKRQKGLSSYSVEALSKMLNEVLAEELYEKAAEIRDEIKRREKAG